MHFKDDIEDAKKLKRILDNGKNVTVDFSGERAKRLWKEIKNHAPGKVETEAVVITTAMVVAVCAAVVGIVVTLAFLACVLYALKLGYHVEADLDAKKGIIHFHFVKH